MRAQGRTRFRPARGGSHAAPPASQQWEVWTCGCHPSVPKVRRGREREEKSVIVLQERLNGSDYTPAYRHVPVSSDANAARGTATFGSRLAALTHEVAVPVLSFTSSYCSAASYTWH